MGLVATLKSRFWPGQSKTERRSDQWIFATILIFASLGLLCSFVLSVEKLKLIADPNATLSCSVNVWLNCASVMKTWQAELFGFPNSYIGLMAYPVIITLAVAKLMGATLPRRFMFGAQIGALLGLIFAYWLFFQSVLVIRVLCPWCLIVTFSTTMIFEALLRYNIRQHNLYMPTSLQKKLEGFVAADYDKLAVVAWVFLMVCMVLVVFSDALL